jgi:tRNA-Thr(GGU) m(6)t(6)A37 methyltransferase TsaA
MIRHCVNIFSNAARRTLELVGKEERSHMKNFSIKPIGFVHSNLKRRDEAPQQGFEGAPNALIKVLPAYRKALHRMQVGDELIAITWLHRGKRNVLKVHPRSDRSLPLTGVFSTRSPDRPNPLGLHRVKVLEIRPGRLRVGPIEAIDGTPVVDIKPVLPTSIDS